MPKPVSREKFRVLRFFLSEAAIVQLYDPDHAGLYEICVFLQIGPPIVLN